MPVLVMRSPSGSLLGQTCHLIVRRQRKYGTERGVPWGVSESAYNARDLELTYQYSNFGVPGLGLKRGLSEDVVVAPYATALAAMIDPKTAAQNFVRLAEAGASGRYGFYEALDYTATRVPENQAVAVVRAYMAHHQGMSLVALANVLHDGVMRARFHAEPRMQATELLLAGTHSAGRPGRPAQGRGGAGGRQRPRSRSTGPASLHLSARPDSRHPPPLQRAIRGDGHDGGLRIQPLARPCGHALARGPHA